MHIQRRLFDRESVLRSPVTRIEHEKSVRAKPVLATAEPQTAATFCVGAIVGEDNADANSANNTFGARDAGVTSVLA
jgi:hypothetical protein